jgi:NADH:ubiquinone oxidoreductase subunit 4 (subunit M)
MNLLNWILALPAAGFLLVLFWPGRTEAARVLALAVSLAVFAVSLGLIPGVWHAGDAHRWVTDIPWINRPPSVTTSPWTASASGW